MARPGWYARFDSIDRVIEHRQPLQRGILRHRPTHLALLLALLGTQPATAAGPGPDSVPRVGALAAASDGPAVQRGASSLPLDDFALSPTEFPAAGSTPVEQVIVAGDALAGSFQAFADDETRRGIATVVRSVSWIHDHYEGFDTAARIRTFLRAAHDLWGTKYVVLGGDVEHVPSRYVTWSTDLILTDLYFECLDGNWNEDGDDRLGEPGSSDGLDNVVSDVVEAPDGSLWVSTYAGLARKTSSGYTTYDFAHGFPSDAVYSVSVAPDGSIWAGTDAGVATWADGSWRVFTIDQGLPTNRVFVLLALAEDDVWAGTDEGLAHWDGTTWRTWGIDDGLPGGPITGIAHDGSSLWVGTFAGLARFDGNSFTVYNTTNSGIRSDWIYGVGIDVEGGVWCGHVEDYLGRGGYSRFWNSTWTSDDLSSMGGVSVREFSFGPGPNEWWAATTDGLLHASGGLRELLGTSNGLPSPEIVGFVRRADGTFALAQSVGLTTGTPGAWSTDTVENGLPQVPATSDNVDLLPDILVGRIPASDPGEVSTYLQKFREYQRGENAAGAENALFVGQVLFDTQDGRDICLDTASAFPSNITRTELYQSQGTLNASSVLSRLNEGPGLVVHVSHGSYDVLGAGTELLFNRDFDAIDSGGKNGFYVVYSCDVGGFDENSVAEHLLFNPNGGAVATLSNTRESLASIDSEFNRAFFETFFASTDGLPAGALRATREEFVAADPDRFQYAGWWRQMYLARSYLGAPTLAIWRTAPAPLVVSHPGTIPFVRTPFEVVVADGVSGLPVAGALVCVSKGTEDYIAGTTDSAGRVTFQFRPETSGIVDVVVGAVDHRPYEGTATVSSATGPALVAAGWANDAGASTLDPSSRARSIAVRLGLRNVGLSDPNPWSVQLASAASGVTILNSTGSIAPIAGGATGWTTPFTLQIAPDLPNGSVASLVLTGSGPAAFSEAFEFPIEAPDLSFEGFVVVGDRIVPRVTNRGSIDVASVYGTLQPASADAIVLDGATSAALLHAGQTATIGEGFRVGGPVAAHFRLEIGGLDASSIVLEVDRERPVGVQSLAADPRDRGARLHWSPSSSPDVVAYRVHARFSNGSWNPNPVARVTEGSNALVNLPAASSREFLVLPVDASGNVSSDSAAVFAHSSPEVMPGWPRMLTSVPGPTSLIAQDLDGDGLQEILLGSMWEANAVHVFHSNGSEWVDGDLDPSTDGVFGVTEGRVNGAPLAVDIDADGALEIFAGSYDGSVHAWRTDGGFAAPPASLPGWPIDHGENGSRVAPVAGDLDGDGALEVVTVGNDGLVRAFEANGAMLPGWPRVTRRKSLGSVPAIADLNGDGRADVVFGATDSTLYAVSGDGTNLPGWPFAVGSKILSSPVLADVDQDGDLEIFALDRSGRFWGLQHRDLDGAPGPDFVSGWPVQLEPLDIAPPSPAVADFDRDGVPEFVVNNVDAVVILRANGSHYGNSPIVTGAKAVNSPVVADLDGDGSLDILVGLDDRRLLALRPDGSILPGWPMTFVEPPTATPAVSDVDGDGRLDVAIAADDATVRVLRLPTPNLPGLAPWPGYHGGADLRGVYQPQPNPPVSAADVALRPTRLHLSPARPNPFREATEIQFELPAAEHATLEIIDVSGRRVATLLSHERLEPGSHRTIWDGRDIGGRAVATGVYFVKLRAGNWTATGRVLHLR